MAFLRRVSGVVVLAAAALLTGCGNFFVCEGKADCPATTTPTNTGDFVYVSNGTAASSDIAGYSLANGTLTAIAGADIDLGFVPIAMSVAPLNGFLYVASRADAVPAGIYVYTISSAGALTPANNGNPLVDDDTISSMDISPDGNFLFTVGTTTTLGTIVSEYELDTSTGLFVAGNPATFLTPTTDCSIVTGVTPLSQHCTIKVSPNGDYVGVALGGYGFEVYPYSSAKGIPGTPGPQLSPSTSTGSGDFSLAFDKNNYVYVASTSALTSYGGLGATGAPSPVLENAQAYTGTVAPRPRAVTLSTNGSYVYTANEGNGTISGFSLSGAGVMTPLGAVPGPTSVSALGADSSGKYLVAAGYNAINGVQVFNITSTGALSSAGSVDGTGVDLTVPTVMALSH
jgi:6-phosphogluconolactonase